MSDRMITKGFPACFDREIYTSSYFADVGFFASRICTKFQGLFERRYDSYTRLLNQAGKELPRLPSKSTNQFHFK